MPACRAQGPSAAEERMMSVYDTFLVLLNSKPMVAQQLAYEVSEIAERYQPQERQEGTPCAPASNKSS